MNPPEDTRAFEAVESDDPDGPSHCEPFPAFVPEETLAAAAAADASPDDRRRAEVFAILFLTVVLDGTREGRREEALSYVTDDAGELSQEWISADVSAGSHVTTHEVEPPRVRSVTTFDEEGVPAGFNVQVVEMVTVPSLDWFYWHMARIEVQVVGGEWRVVDYQPVVASEDKEFSPSMWEAALDSGENWRSFVISEGS